ELKAAGKTKVKESAPKDKSKPEANIVRDENDIAVPPHLIDVFANLKDYDEVLSLARKLKKALSDMAQTTVGILLRTQLQLDTRKVKATLPNGKEVEEEVEYFRSIHLQNVENELKYGRPFAICPYCFCGKKCGVNEGCKKRGFVSEDQWGRAPKEMRE